MTNTQLKTVPLKSLVKPKNNPRKSFDEEKIKGLAENIKTDGVLQNLIVKPVEGKKNKFEIIGGERRYSALKYLVKTGEIKNDYPVPVSIKSGLNVEDIDRVAVMENLQREDMPPLDEAHAVTNLLREGITVEDIAVKTGLTTHLIKQRIKLTTLCGEAQSALREKKINVSQAQALTIGSHDQQKELIEEGLEGSSISRIKASLTSEKVPLSRAIFDTNTYKGNITFDLFADENESYFDDRDLFLKMQEEAVEALKQEKEDLGYAPVEIFNESYFQKWNYDEAGEGELGGCVIHHHPNGSVEIYDGLTKPSKKGSDVELEEKPKATYSNPLCEYIGMQKTIAVQDALIANPRKAKEVAVVLMLADQKTHSCFRYFERTGLSPKALENINHFAKPLLNSAGFDIEDEDSVLVIKNTSYVSPPNRYDYVGVQQLTDEELDQLHLFLTTIQFGQETMGLDSYEDSIFNQVAIDLEINMQDYWVPDEYFLSRLKADKLDSVISETETSHLFGTVSGYKKKDIVSMLAKHFEKLASQDICEEQDLKAKYWLPEVFSFPAVDPDEEQEKETESDELSNVA